MKNIAGKAKELIKQFTDHMNVEIQQRACEYLQLLDKKWDDERMGIFEPIPIKSDLESKGRLFEAQEDRPDFDDNEGDEDSLPKPASGGAIGQITSKPSTITPVSAGGSGPANNNNGNIIDLDDLLGGFGSKTTTPPQT